MTATGRSLLGLPDGSDGFGVDDSRVLVGLLVGGATVPTIAPVTGPSDSELIELTGGRRQVQTTVEWELLDQELEHVDWIAPSRDSVVTIENVSTRTTKRTASGFFLDHRQQGRVDVIRHRLKPWWILQNGSRFPLGVFLFDDALRQRTSYGLDLTGSLGDLTFILDQLLDHTVSEPDGTVITELMAKIVRDAGIPLSIIVPSPQTLTAPFTKALGQAKIYDALADLCALVGYWPPYFDNDGALRLRPATDLATATPDPRFMYGPGRISAEQPIAEADSLITAPDRFLLVDTSPTDTPVSAIYDVPASAPHSFRHRKFHVVAYTTVQGIDPAAAPGAVRAYAAANSGAFANASFQAAPDPRHDTFDVVGYNDLVWIEDSWRLVCANGGPMSHDVRRVWTDE